MREQPSCMEANVIVLRRHIKIKLKPATGRTLRPCVSRQPKDASTHRSTFCGLRSAFEQSDQLGALGRQRIHANVTGDKTHE